MQKQFNDKKEMLERKVRIENEERIVQLQEKMMREFEI